MPELPEVEIIRSQLNRHLPGLTLKQIEFLDPKAKRYIEKARAAKIIGQAVVEVGRRGKILTIKFANNYYLVFHLKMTGQVILRNAQVDYLPNKHTRAILYFSKKEVIFFQDLRRFGWLKILKPEELSTKLLKEKYGPDPLGANFTLAYFQSQLAKTQKPIKVFLMDQSKIAGIGNIYANEALFLAKINPQKKANKLTKKEAERLFKQIKFVLQKGIDLGGASDNAYLNAYGKKGKYQKHFLVYRRQGQPCFNCKTKIKRIVVGGRGTFYCPKCQPL